MSYVHWAKQYSKLPIVAIGGIKVSNVESVWKVHPDFICAVSELIEPQDLKNTVYELMSGYSKVR
nr:thiamine phosphate synthase [Veillonella sp. oral taxon 158]